MSKPWLDERLAVNERAVRDNFKDWFTESAVVDTAGQPLVVFHGTRKSFDAFDSTNSIFDDGALFFTDNAGAAENYARDSDLRLRKGSHIIPVYLRILDPLRIDFGGDSDIDGLMEVREEAIAKGHDGVIALNTNDGYGLMNQYVCFSAHQIKSALGNSGLYLHHSASLTDHHEAQAFSLARQARAHIHLDANGKMHQRKRP